MEIKCPGCGEEMEVEMVTFCGSKSYDCYKAPAIACSSCGYFVEDWAVENVFEELYWEEINARLEEFKLTNK